MATKTLIKLLEEALKQLSAGPGRAVNEDLCDETRRWKSRLMGLEKQANTLADTHFQLGNILYFDGDLDKAIAEYREAIKLNPDYESAHYNLGSALEDKGDLDEAETEFRKAIEINPNNVKACYRLGYILVKKEKKTKGNLEEAIADFSKAIELKPDFTGAYIKRGYALLVYAAHFADKNNSDDRDTCSTADIMLNKAITDFSKAIELEPDSKLAYLVYYMQGLAKADIGDTAGAIADCDKAIELCPYFPGAYKLRGIVKEKKGDFEGAKKDFEAFEALSCYKTK